MTLARQRRRRLMAACIVMTAIGFIYGWSVFSAPLANEFEWEPTVLSFTFTVLMWAFCAGGIIGARVTRATSSRATLLLSAIGILAAFALTALFVSQDTAWVTYVAYGALGGCSVGMAYTTTMGTVVAWFPDRTGLVSGIMLLCYGISTMLLSSVAAWCFDLIGWRWSFIALSACIAGIVALASFALCKPNADEIRLLQAPGKRTPLPAQAKESVRRAAGDLTVEHTTRCMLKQPSFHAYACWMLAVSCIGLGLIGTANQLALDAGASAATAVAIVGILSLCNGCGRLLTGFVFDLAGAAPTMAIVAGAHTAGCVLILAAIMRSSVPLMIAGTIIGGLGIGGTSVVGSGFIAKAFGSLHYAENLSILNLTLIPAALIGPFIMGLSATESGSYDFGAIGLVAVGMIAMLLVGIMKSLLKRSTHRPTR